MAQQPRKKPKPKPKTYDWMLTPPGKIDCYESEAKKQTVTSLWDLTGPTEFHTADLARATKTIRGILEDVESADRRRNQRLSFIEFDGRFLLVWANDAKRPSKKGIRSDSEYSRIARALKLRAPRSLRQGQQAVTRSWVMLSDGTVRCFKSDNADCVVSKLWETLAPTAWHPPQLMQATKNIQKVLNELERGNKHPKRRLAFICYDYRPLLAWVDCDTVGSDDDIPVVRKALKLKAAGGNRRIR
jgi:hypothetical protein